MKLKDLLSKPVYEAQKKLFASILDGGKKEIKKRADDIYVLQKHVIKDLQDNLVAKAKEEAKDFYYDNFDKVCFAIEKSVPFFGKIIASVLRKYEDKIIGAIL